MTHDVSLFDLLSSLSEAVDLISPRVAGHHLQTAWIAYSIGLEMNMDPEALASLVVASSLHDVGGLSLHERLDALRFDAEDNRHGQIGAALLSQFPPFASISRVIREHHLPWDEMQTPEARLREPDLTDTERRLRGVLFLADRVDVLILQDSPLLPQVAGIVGQLAEAMPGRFFPEAYAAFREVAVHEDFWMSLEYGMYRDILTEAVPYGRLTIGGQEMKDMISLFSRIVDFRSHYTATHSAAVAACAGLLGGKMGLPVEEQLMLEMAGHLHDLGKLSIPMELLEKNDPLTCDEFNLIRGHSFLTGRVLRHLKGFEQIRDWSAQHHERINGTGYPSRIRGESLSLGSRILAVSDVFVALTEERPYRVGMTMDKVRKVMDQMADQACLDPELMGVLEQNMEEMNTLREWTQGKAHHEYDLFSKALLTDSN